MKSILFSTFLFVSVIANAQFMKDDKFIGGTFYATVQKSSNGSNSEGNYSSCTLSPSGGFFLNDKYAIGGGIGYSVTRQKYEYDPDVNQEYRINAVEVHAFASRYFVIADRFFFRATGSLYYDREHRIEENNDAEFKSKSYTIGINIRPSLLFFPTSNWGIEAGIGNFGISHWRSLSYENKSTSVSLDYGSFYLGFAYYFRTPRG
jgi:hypothetical protein